MAQKNIYIKEEDLGLIEWAESKNLSLSGLFADCLKGRKRADDRRHELQKAGFETISVKVVDRDENIRNKQFEGRWIVEEFRTEDEDFDAGRTFNAALTKGGRIVVTAGRSDYEPDDFTIYDSVDDALSDEQIPADFASAIAAETGEEYVEVLDI